MNAGHAGNPGPGRGRKGYHRRMAQVGRKKNG